LSPFSYNYDSFYDTQLIKSNGYILVNEDTIAEWKFLEFWAGALPVMVMIFFHSQSYFLIPLSPIPKTLTKPWKVQTLYASHFGRIPYGQEPTPNLPLPETNDIFRRATILYHLLIHKESAPKNGPGSLPGPLRIGGPTLYGKKGLEDLHEAMEM
jgi:hypothetical protein